MFPNWFYPYGYYALWGLFILGYLVLYLKCQRFRSIRCWWVVFGLFLIANALDFYTTWLVVDRFGAEYEQNQAARALMYADWRYLAIRKLVFWPAMAAIGLLVMRFLARLAIVLFLAMTTALFVASINNIVVYIRLLAGS